MKKYAAGGKCGTMSSSSFSAAEAEGASKDGVKEVNAKLSAALAERAKQDALFSSPAPASASASALAKQQQPEKQKQHPAQAIVALPPQKPAPVANQKYSDINLILSGDFQEEED
jgi:hypothetical protein